MLGNTSLAVFLLLLLKEWKVLGRISPSQAQYTMQLAFWAWACYEPLVSLHPESVVCNNSMLVFSSSVYTAYLVQEDSKVPQMNRGNASLANEMPPLLGLGIADIPRPLATLHTW